MEPSPTPLPALRRSRRPIGLLIGGGAVVLLTAMVVSWRGGLTAGVITDVVRRGELRTQLTVSGSLRPAQSITYRSPLGGRESEVMYLVPEGTHVGEGDLLARLDTTELQRELERTVQEARQTQIELQVAEIEWQAAQGVVDSLAAGEGALGITETQSRLQGSQKKVVRLTAEFDAMKPLFQKGFITREELNRTADALEQAQSELALDQQRASVLVDQTHPREEQRAKLQLAQRAAQLENVRSRDLEVAAHMKLLRQQIDDCAIYSRRPGLAVHEEYLGGSPRRKVRPGDRVTSSQGLVTIPEVDRMLLQGLVSEADVHRLKAGQSASIRLEAFPALRLTGKVVGVGTLASSSSDRPRDDKRFDLVIELDSTDPGLRPEMTARADVDIGLRQNVLLIPINAVFERDGLPFCYVSHRLSTETRQIQLGESNSLYVEVLAGLEAGDRVRLDEGVTPAATETGRSAQPLIPINGRSGQESLSPR